MFNYSAIFFSKLATKFTFNFYYGFIKKQYLHNYQRDITLMIGSDHSKNMAGKLYRNTFKIYYAGENLISVSECDLNQNFCVGETAKRDCIKFSMAN
jgi:hypothetical protein